MRLPVLRFLLLVSLAIGCLAVVRGQGTPPPQTTDLDAFMSRVLARRDENWKKLQQYVLEERETLQVIGPGASPLYGFRRESAWFPRDGRFVKSPLRVNGVTVSEGDRRTFEDLWLKREDLREKRRAERAAKGDRRP